MKKSEIEEAIKKGKNNISELARYFNLTPATIRYYIDKYSLRNEIKKKKRKCDKKEIEKLYREGKSVSEISSLLGVTDATIRYYLKQPKAPVKKVSVAVMACKGGVGKTLISCTLAHLLSEAGFKVRLIDCDITAPDVLITLGHEFLKPRIESGKLKPHIINNIELFSFASLQPKAVLWGGEQIKNIVLQFLTNVDWSNEEVTIYDIPAGTRDELQAISSIVDKALIVCEPTTISVFDAQKAVNACHFYGIKPLGIVINKSKIICNGTEIKLGNLTAKEISSKTKLKVICEIPFITDNDKIQKLKAYLKDIIEMILK